MSDPNDLDALKDLTQSRGWHLFKDMVMADIAGAFESDITQALAMPDAPLAIDKMRQVAAVRLAGLRWLRLPQERVQTLTDQVVRKADAVSTMSRRPVGV